MNKCSALPHAIDHCRSRTSPFSCLNGIGCLLPLTCPPVLTCWIDAIFYNKPTALQVFVPSLEPWNHPVRLPSRSTVLRDRQQWASRAFRTFTRKMMDLALRPSQSDTNGHAGSNPRLSSWRPHPQLFRGRPTRTSFDIGIFSAIVWSVFHFLHFGGLPELSSLDMSQWSSRVQRRKKRRSNIGRTAVMMHGAFLLFHFPSP